MDAPTMTMTASSTTTTLFVATYDRFECLAHAPRGTESTANESLVSISLNEATGEMTAHSAVSGVLNPSFIRYHPDLDKIYVATECIDTAGEVVTYNVDRNTGALELIDRQSAQGSSTCFLTITPNRQHLLFVNYWDSTLGVMPLDEAGALGPAVHVQPPPAPVRAGGLADHLANRQSEPHAHAIVLEPFTYSIVLVPDLGTDEIRQYVFDASAGTLTPAGKVACAPHELGPHGPRYLEFDPRDDAAYVVNELSSTVSLFRFDRAAAALLADAVLRGGATAAKLAPRDVPVLSFVSLATTRPAAPPAHRNTCGRIAVDPSGGFVLVSNRGDDTIACLRIERDGSVVKGLSPVQIESTRGATPRHFQFTPSGQWLLAANQDTNSLASFAFDATSGRLTFSGHLLGVNSPNFVCAMPTEASRKRTVTASRRPIAGSGSTEL